MDRPDPIVFMPLVVSTSGRLYHDFLLLLFLHTHRETSVPENYKRNLISFDSYALSVWLILMVCRIHLG